MKHQKHHCNTIVIQDVIEFFRYINGGDFPHDDWFYRQVCLTVLDARTVCVYNMQKNLDALMSLCNTDTDEAHRIRQNVLDCEAEPERKVRRYMLQGVYGYIKRCVMQTAVELTLAPDQRDRLYLTASPDAGG